MYLFQFINASEEVIKKKHLTVKNCDKTFLKNIVRLLKNHDISTFAKRHY